MGPRSPGNRRPHFFGVYALRQKLIVFVLFKFELIISINFEKFLKLSILLDGSESRLLTAQDSAAAKPLLLFQSKSHDSMDST